MLSIINLLEIEIEHSLTDVFYTAPGDNFNEGAGGKIMFHNILQMLVH